MPSIQIIEDDAPVRQFIKRMLEAGNYEFVESDTGTAGVVDYESQRPDCVLCDVELPGLNGLAVLEQIRRIDPSAAVVIMTGQGTIEWAMRAMALGAVDYLLKPLDTLRLRSTVANILKSQQLPSGPRSHPAASDSPIVGRSDSMYEVFKLVGRVAPQNTSVLIEGETGTGKEMIARAIHAHSPRRDGPFIAINCAALPDALLESELFGHEKGAFTGADRQRQGKFELANDGTLFLDELGEMALSTQAKLLRVLQDQEFTRLGGTQIIRTNARIVSATNRDLRSDISSGRFREDLFYRLAVFAIALPPLRDRIVDIPLLVDHLIQRFSSETGRSVHAVAPDAMDLLVNHRWPGNVRELTNAVHLAVLSASGPVLLPESFSHLNRGSSPLDSALPAANATRPANSLLEQSVREAIDRNETNILKSLLSHSERLIIEQAVRLCEGNISRAARHLGIHRVTLKAKLKDFPSPDESIDSH